MTYWLGTLGCGLTSLALGLVVFVLAVVPAAQSPSLGQRGARRRAALSGSSLFASVEPALRRLAGWSAVLPLGNARARFEPRLVHAGYYLGLSADEACALSLLGALLGIVSGLAWVRASQASFVWLIMTTVLGALAFSLQLDLEIRRRRNEVDRQLPPAIDLLSLCVGAGADFPSALRFVLNEAGGRGALEQELETILSELLLGHTRKRAISAFAERTPTAAVRDFANAVCQAEEKGNPLAEVLEIQARVLRMRRSVAAEEAAAKAGVRLMLPLVLLMLCVMLILFGSLMVKGVDGGL